MSSILNDPSFNYESTHVKTGSARDVTYRAQPVYPRVNWNPTVTARKTEVDGQQQVSPHDYSESEASNVPYCPLHKAHHTLNKCRSFKLLSIKERKEILFKSKFCFRCCKSIKHTAKDCKEVIECTECGSSRHTSAMHISLGPQRAADNQDSKSYGGERTFNVSSKCSQVCGANFTGKSCAKTILVNVYPQGQLEKGIHLYAIIDDQSNRTLEKSQLFDALDIDPSRTVSYNLSSCNGAVTTSGRQANGLVVESVTEERRFDLPVIIECDQIPNVQHEIPTPEVVEHYPHLKHLVDRIPTVESDSPILLLIGRDLPEAHHVLEQCTGPRGSPFAQHLPLGCVIVGEVCLGDVHQPCVVNVNKTNVLSSGRPTHLDPCKSSFCVQETVPVSELCFGNEDGEVSSIGATAFQRTKDDEKVGSSVEDRLFLQLMDKEFAKNYNGNWSAPLPFKPQRQRLPSNIVQALKRAKLLEANLKKNPQKKKDFVDFMKDILESGHAELASPIDRSDDCWYLPIFRLYHPKKPTHLRGVFDSSSVHEGVSLNNVGVSLNNVLMTGPDLTNNLLGVLLRFRRDSTAVMTDIQKMFYCFYVKEERRDFLRFFWFKNNDPEEELVEYRMCVHVFGNSPSPAVATYGLRKTVENCEQIYGSDVKDVVNKSFYVDDALVSTPTCDQSVSLVRRTQEALKTEGDLRLHTIASNKKEVMAGFPQDDLVKDLKSLNIAEDCLPLQHRLGLAWDLNSESFMFKFEDSQFDKPFTRRGLLSAINGVFDPLGFLVPITIQGYLLLRELSGQCCDWDEELPIGRQEDWGAWITSMKELNGVQISRMYVPSSLTEAVSHEVHLYSDASEKAIAAVAYIRVKDEQGSSRIGFIMGKAKVAPSHSNTVPRLELCAAVLTIEIAEFVCEHLDIAVDMVRYHTDSKVVLGYVRNETRRFYIYVSNRVGRIRRFSDPEQWSYVHTDMNPADVDT